MGESCEKRQGVPQPILKDSLDFDRSDRLCWPKNIDKFTKKINPKKFPSPFCPYLSHWLASLIYWYKITRRKG